jgi:hypothetical protein
MAKNSKSRRLNGPQAKFARLIAEGEKDVEAYKQCWKWENYSPTGLRSQVTKKRNHPLIVEEVARIQNELADKAVITAESLIIELEEARTVAKKDMNASAMVQATMGKAKLCGLDKVVVEVQASEELTPWTSIVAGIAAAVDNDAA